MMNISIYNIMSNILGLSSNFLIKIYEKNIFIIYLMLIILSLTRLYKLINIKRKTSII